MGGIVQAEEVAQLAIGPFRLIHLPHAPVVAQERVHRRGPLDARLQRGAGQGQTAPLGRAGGAHASGVHLVQRHHHARQRNGVQEDLPVQEPVGAIRQPADDVAVQRVAAHPANVLRPAALPAAVERRHGKAGRGVAEQLRPLRGAAAVAVEHEQRRAGSGRRGRLQQLGVDARAAHAGEVQVPAAGERHLKPRRRQLHRGLHRVQLGAGARPILIEVRGPRIATGVALQLGEGKIEQTRHQPPP